MSPDLFSLFINYIDSELKTAEIHPPHIKNKTIPSFLFADDVVAL